MRAAIPLILLALSLGCRSSSPSPSAAQPAGGTEPTASTPPAPEPAPPKMPSGATRTNKSTIRAGVRRLEAVRAERYRVRFEADGSLKLEQVDRALGGDRLAAVVGPFDQTKRGGNASDVADAGQIVALALARQLEALGWSALVAVDDPATETDGATNEGEKKPDKDAPTGRPTLTRLSFAGEVTFWAEQNGATATAALEGTISVRDAAAAEILRSQVKARAEVRRSVERSAVRRVERAQQAALASFVRRFLTDPRLGDALVRTIKAARGGR